MVLDVVGWKWFNPTLSMQQEIEDDGGYQNKIGAAFPDFSEHIASHKQKDDHQHVAEPKVDGLIVHIAIHAEFVVIASPV